MLKDISSQFVMIGDGAPAAFGFRPLRAFGTLPFVAVRTDAAEIPSCLAVATIVTPDRRS